MPDLRGNAEVAEEGSQVAPELTQAYQDGDLIILECAFSLSVEQRRMLQQELAMTAGETGKKFLLLDPGITVARPDTAQLDRIETMLVDLLESCEQEEGDQYL